MPDPAQRIEEQAAALPPAERRVAEVVLADPPAAAFATVAEVGALARTSGATVVRLANRLGYAGWPGLQRELRDGLQRRLRPAVQRIREHPGGDLLAATAVREADNVHETIAAVDRSDFEQAVARLSDPRRTVHVLAGTAAEGIGTVLADALALLRPGVERLAGSPVRVSAQLAHLEPGDVVVAIDLRRYERWVVDTVALAASGGAVVLAVTDSRLSPLAQAAEVCFTVAAEGAGPFDSHVGTLALLNALASGVAARRRRPATRRLDRVEAAWERAGALS